MTSTAVYESFGERSPFFFDDVPGTRLVGSFSFIVGGASRGSDERSQEKILDSDQAVVRTFRSSKTVAELGSLTARRSEAEPLYLSSLPDSYEVDEVRRIIRGFETVPAGWDGPESQPPIDGVVQDALEVLQNWASNLGIPEPVLAFDGSVALELYDDQGFTRGGIEFHGEHQAVFTVVSRSELLASGTFDAGSLSDIVRSLSKIEQALSSK